LIHGNNGASEQTLPTMKPIHLNKLILLAALWLCGLPVLAGNRLALVIGNKNYTVGQLTNPINDARAMAAKLTSLGFQVQPVEDLKVKDIDPTLHSFISKIKPGDEVVVFYAGHGMQIDGVNYFQAVDADITYESQVARNSLSLNVLLAELEASKAAVKILFLDACRKNPFRPQIKSTKRTLPRGLMAVGEPPEGTVIQFATAADGEADDGNGSNGVYTLALLDFIDVPGLAIEDVIKKVRTAVVTKTRGTGRPQVPWSQTSFTGDFYFTTAPVQKTAVPSLMEDAAWKVCENARTLSPCEGYLTEYPKGVYAKSAVLRIQDLRISPITASVFNLDWRNIPILASAINRKLDIIKAIIWNNNLCVFIHGEGLGSNYILFFDSDNNEKTGFQVIGFKKSGADFMLAGGLLYIYSKNGSEWGWVPVFPILFHVVAKSNVMEVRIPLAVLGIYQGHPKAPANIGLGFQVLKNNFTLDSQLPPVPSEFAKLVLNP
jgi:hypothetical protein